MKLQQKMLKFSKFHTNVVRLLIFSLSLFHQNLISVFSTLEIDFSFGLKFLLFFPVILST